MKKALVTIATLAIAQLINERVAPAALELRQVGIHQDYPLRAFAADIGHRVPTCFGCHPWQRQQLVVG